MNPHEEQRLDTAVRQAGAACAPVVQRELERAYGADWLTRVNAARTAAGHSTGRGLHDNRFVLSLVAHEPALAATYDDEQRAAARHLNGIANADAHDEPLEARDCQRAEEFSRRLCEGDLDQPARAPGPAYGAGAPLSTNPTYEPYPDGYSSFDPLPPAHVEPDALMRFSAESERRRARGDRFGEIAARRELVAIHLAAPGVAGVEHAKVELRRVLALFRELGDEGGAARTLGQLKHLEDPQGAPSGAAGSLPPRAHAPADPSRARGRLPRLPAWAQEEAVPSVVVGVLLVACVVLSGAAELVAQLLLLVLAAGGALRLLRVERLISQGALQLAVGAAVAAAILLLMLNVGGWNKALVFVAYLVLAWFGVEELVRRWGAASGPDSVTAGNTDQRPSEYTAWSRRAEVHTDAEASRYAAREASLNAARTVSRNATSTTSSLYPRDSFATESSCPVQGKVGFATAADAQQAVQRSQERHRSGRSPYAEPLQGEYRCPSCGDWHVTRQSS